MTTVDPTSLTTRTGRTSVRRELEQIIERGDVATHVQPILDLRRGTAYGYEVLNRPPRWSQFPHAGAMFAAAEALGLLWDLEAVCRRRALLAAESIATGCLFLNVTPTVFADVRFVPTLLAELQQNPNLPCGRVVLELTEFSDNGLLDALSLHFDRLRALGFQLAIDDVGAGTSGLNRIMELRPNWLKLDRHLIASIDQDPVRRNFLKMMVHFARLSNIKVVAEGIERDEELTAVIEARADFGQGYLLGKPSPWSHDADRLWEERIPMLYREIERRSIKDPREIRLGELGVAIPSCSSAISLGEAVELVARCPDVPGLCLLEGRRVVGLVTSRRIRTASESSGYNADMPLMALSSTGWSIAAPDASVLEGIELLIARRDQHLNEPLLVVSDDIVHYLPVRQLLQMATQSSLRSALHTTTLTGLPDRAHADLEFSRRIEQADASSVAFVDLRDFRRYNRTYGIELADALLVHLARMLIANFQIDAGAGSVDYVAHLESDRFAVISDSERMEGRLRSVAEQFDASRSQFFTPSDFERRSYVHTDQSGQIFVPLTSARIVHLQSPFRYVANASDLHDLASRLRRCESTDHRVGPILPASSVVLTAATDAVPFRCRPANSRGQGLEGPARVCMAWQPGVPGSSACRVVDGTSDTGRAATPSPPPPAGSAASDSASCHRPAA